MAVPFFDVQYNLEPEVKDELLARWKQVLDHGYFVNGPEILELEQDLAQFLGVPHVVACSNGSDALVLALKAAGVKPGDEVIVPSFTFFASAGSVARLGATPIFADVHPATLLICPRSAASLVTERTKAVMPVHLYGRPVDVGVLKSTLKAAAGREITVVEDAAQAIGAVHADGPCGGLGLTAGFSCFPTKNLAAAGDAGFATSRDEKTAERMRRLRQHGGGRQYYHDEVGFNFRLSALQAAALIQHLPRLVEWNAARYTGAQHYAELFGGASLGDKLTAPEVIPGHVFHQYVIRTPRRDELMNHLRALDIGCAVYYPLPLHLQPCFQYLGGFAGQLPTAELAAKEVLALPIYPGVTAEQRQTVVAAIVDGLK
ncbi:MAG: DegT/DnrJ/EryC1/StrS family aminotransferase [Planctomycetes bacterium]|nr:DegT/DnrJ/EryC1/StrS family aminotransferase [Planctomycetota bacterium]